MPTTTTNEHPAGVEDASEAFASGETAELPLGRGPARRLLVCGLAASLAVSAVFLLARAEHPHDRAAPASRPPATAGSPQPERPSHLAPPADTADTNAVLDPATTQGSAADAAPPQASPAAAGLVARHGELANGGFALALPADLTVAQDGEHYINYWAPDSRLSVAVGAEPLGDRNIEQAARDVIAAMRAELPGLRVLNRTRSDGGLRITVEFTDRADGMAGFVDLRLLGSTVWNVMAANPTRLAAQHEVAKEVVASFKPDAQS
jgi:hypothetical protein